MNKPTDFSKKEDAQNFIKMPASYETILYPELMKLIGNVNGKRIIDIGCGPGDLSRKLANRGGEITGVDLSKEFIDYCKNLEDTMKDNIEYFCMDASNLSKLYGKTYNLAVMDMVFINISNRKTIGNIFKETYKILGDNGRVIFSTLHPIQMYNKENLTERQTLPKDFSYFKSGVKFDSDVLLSDSSRIHLQDIHWKLEDYLDILKRNNFVVTDIREPHPIKKGLIGDYRYPEFIIFEAKKDKK